jgi:hypothetical protein
MGACGFCLLLLLQLLYLSSNFCRVLLQPLMDDLRGVLIEPIGDESNGLRIRLHGPAQGESV